MPAVPKYSCTESSHRSPIVPPPGIFAAKIDISRSDSAFATVSPYPKPVLATYTAERACA